MECDDNVQVGGAPSSTSTEIASSMPISQAVKVELGALDDDNVVLDWEDLDYGEESKGKSPPKTPT